MQQLELAACGSRQHGPARRRIGRRQDDTRERRPRIARASSASPSMTGECMQLAAGHDRRGAGRHRSTRSKGLFDYVADRCREQRRAARREVARRARQSARAVRAAARRAARPGPAPGAARDAGAGRARAPRRSASRHARRRRGRARPVARRRRSAVGRRPDAVDARRARRRRGCCSARCSCSARIAREELNDGLRELMKTPGCAALEVARLEHTTVGSIVADMLAMRQPPQPLVQLLATRSDGNPFFVAEYLRTAVAEGLLFRAFGTWTVAGHGEGPERFESLDVPASLRDLVGRRLAGLSRRARGLAEAAGGARPHAQRRCRDAQSREATQDDALDALKELLTKQVLVEVGTGSFRFIHDKLREITLRPHRRRAPARAASSRRGADGSARARPRTTSSRSTSPKPASPQISTRRMRYLERAGDQARKSFANRDAVRIYNDLLALATRVARPVAPLSSRALAPAARRRVYGPRQDGRRANAPARGGAGCSAIRCRKAKRGCRSGSRPSGHAARTSAAPDSVDRRGRQHAPRAHARSGARVRSANAGLVLRDRRYPPHPLRDARERESRRARGPVARARARVRQHAPHHRADSVAERRRGVLAAHAGRRSRAFRIRRCGAGSASSRACTRSASATGRARGKPPRKRSRSRAASAFIAVPRRRSASSPTCTCCAANSRKRSSCRARPATAACAAIRRRSCGATPAKRRRSFTSAASRKRSPPPIARRHCSPK